MDYTRKSALKSQYFISTAMFIVIVAANTQGALAQSANTTPANVNVLNLLSPFLSLNSTTIGQQTLTTNLSQAIAVNNAAATNPTQAAQSISDKTIFGGASTNITLSSGATASYGPGANLAGGLPLQAVQSAGGIAPVQAVGGLGVQLGPIFQSAVAPSGAGTPAVVSLLVNAYNFTSSDLGVGKNYFANGTINGTVTAVAPSGYTLPTASGLPNTTNSVYDLAYGVKNTGTGQDIYGDSRPVQAVGTGANGINGYDPTALTGLATNPSFPSGHTNYAYTDSILIGMLVPQEFTGMLERASTYGNSRIELGLHYPLDIISSRSFAEYDLAQAFTNPLYQNNAATTGTAINLPSLFNVANAQLSPYLAAQCGASVATCAASSANNTNNPYVNSAANLASYTANLTYGLPTLTFAQAPQEAAPAGGPDASILLATIYGGSTSSALAIAPNGGTQGSLSTATINQIIVNTETNALAAFYGTSLSYWSRINLVAATDYFAGGSDGYGGTFAGTTGTLMLASTDKVTVPVTVGAGSTIGGNGTIAGATTVLSGGTLAPATAANNAATGPGTLTINGALTFNSGATYALQVGSTASTTAVSGAATLGGASVNATFASNAALQKQYTILSAGSISGTFGTLTNTNLPTGVTDTVSVSGSNAYLNVAIAAPAGSTGNQGAVSSAFNSYLSTNGSLPNVYVGLSSSAVQQASGLTGTGGTAASFGAMNEFGAVLSGGSDGNGGVPATGGALGYADTGHGRVVGSPFAAVDADLSNGNRPTKLATVIDPQWSIWTSAFGASGTVGGNNAAGSATTQSQVWGLAVGADKYISPTTILGFGMGGGGTNYSLANGLGSGHSDLFQAGATFKQLVGPAYVSGLLAYGWQDVTTTRNVAIGVPSSLRGRFNVNSLEERIEAGNRFDTTFAGVTPFAAAQLTSLFLPSYGETVLSGSPAFALNYASKTINDPRTELGVKFDKVMPVEGGSLTLKSSVAWAYDYNVSNTVNATFQALPGASFTSTGARPSPNSAIVSAGSELKLANGWSFASTIKGEFSASTTDVEGKATVKYSW